MKKIYGYNSNSRSKSSVQQRHESGVFVLLRKAYLMFDSELHKRGVIILIPTCTYASTLLNKFLSRNKCNDTSAVSTIAWKIVKTTDNNEKLTSIINSHRKHMFLVGTSNAATSGGKSLVTSIFATTDTGFDRAVERALLAPCTAHISNFFSSAVIS